jgi:hypothetical protein
VEETIPSATKWRENCSKKQNVIGTLEKQSPDPEAISSAQCAKAGRMAHEYFLKIIVCFTIRIGKLGLDSTIGCSDF